MRIMIWDKKKEDFFTLFEIKRIIFAISSPVMRIEDKLGTKKNYALSEYEIYTISSEGE